MSIAAPEPVVVVHARYEAPPGPPRRMRHPHHHLSLLLRGQGRYRVGGAELPMGEPAALFLPAGDEDFNHLVGPMDAWYTGFRWPGLRVRPAGRMRVVLSWGARTVRLRRWKRLDALAVTRLTECYAALKHALQRQDLAGKLRAQGLLLQLFSLYADLPESPAQTTGHRALLKFCELLQTRDSAGVRLETIAAEAGITADHLRELFRDRFGLRPVEYRRGLQLVRARDLLAGSNLNVKQVAREVGFSDPLYFSRVFKRQFGISPGAIVRRYRFSD